MATFDIKGSVLKYITDNPNGVDVDSIIDFLDYINKLRYKKEEVNLKTYLIS